MNLKSTRGGRREGAGRPKGRKDPHTIQREAVLAEYRKRVCEQAQRLLDAEMSVAVGCSYLFRKPKEAPKGQKERKIERVTDEETIRAYLNGELDDDNDYYFITTEKPDTLTIRGMFDRTFDKPGQRVEVSGDPDQPLIPSAIQFVFTQQPDSENRT